MIAAAINGYGLFEVDSREVRRAGPSFTIDTVEEVADERPGSELFLMIGSDILHEIRQWHRVGEVSRKARIAVMTRADSEEPMVEALEIDYLRVEVSYIAISSSEIRERIAMRRPFRYLVPDPVYEIIREHGLYGFDKSEVR
jgi:nicotinate-nucleotide adenylyltransferase